MEAMSGKKPTLDLDKEKNSFDNLKNQIKSSLFGVFFVMLKDTDTSLPLVIFMELINFFQITIFPFHSSVFPFLSPFTIQNGLYSWNRSTTFGEGNES